MRVILEKLTLILSLLASICPLIYMLNKLSRKKKIVDTSVSNSEESNRSITKSWEDTMEIIMILLTVTLTVFLMFFLNIRFKLSFFPKVLIISGCCYHIIRFTNSIEIVKDIIVKPQKADLAEYEIMSLFVLSFFVVLTENYIIKIINWLLRYITNDVLYNIIIVSYYSLNLIIKLFLIFTFTFLGILFILEKRQMKKSSIHNITERYNDFLESIETKQFDFRTILLCKKLRVYKGKKYIGIFIIIGTFIIEIPVQVLIFLAALILSPIYWVMKLCNILSKELAEIRNYLLHLSKKRMVSIIFRISLVISLVLIVTVNQHETFLKCNNESSSVLEFIASTIIIPIVFDWIHSLQAK